MVAMFMLFTMATEGCILFNLCLILFGMFTYRPHICYHISQ